MRRRLDQAEECCGSAPGRRGVTATAPEGGVERIPAEPRAGERCASVSGRCEGGCIRRGQCHAVRASGALRGAVGTVPRRRRSPLSTFGIALLIVFVLVPLPIVLAMPEAPFYATARAILAVPFGVLIATAGLACLNEIRSPLRTAASLVLIVSMPWQFASFARDYFDEYQRSAR